MQWWAECCDCERNALLIQAEIAMRERGSIRDDSDLRGLRVVTRKHSDLLQLANPPLCHQINSEAAQPVPAFVVFSSNGGQACLAMSGGGCA
jgi:hypothetical protein